MLLDRLKEETRHAHDRIGEDLALMRGDLSLAAYGTLLTRLHGFLAGWEPAVDAALGDPAFLAPRRKTGLLAADLHRLGLKHGPACRDLPALPSRAAALGSLYVMEGATLGGQVIRRHVEGLFGFGADGPTAYFGSYGTQVGRRWQEMRDRLAALPDQVAPEAVAAALATFGCLHRWTCPGTAQETAHV